MTKTTSQSKSKPKKDDRSINNQLIQKSILKQIDTIVSCESGEE
jgi:hypothetical protein